VNLLTRLRSGGGQRSIASLEDYIAAVGGLSGYSTLEQTLTGKAQRVGETFPALAAGAYASNGVVYACMAVRQAVFSTIRFRHQRLSDGKPSEMFGTPALSLLERPWVGGTTQDLLARTIQDADLAGNSFWTTVEGYLLRLRPDWVEIAVEPLMYGGGQIGWRKLGYVYYEGGKHSGSDGVALHLTEVSHFMPTPDPLAPFRGMSWLTPVVREIESDLVMTRHKRKFFEQGATPNMIIKHDVSADRDKILNFAKRLDAQTAGTDNAYKTMHLYPGADATVVGSDMQKIDFKAVQGAGETRIAAAAGVPTVIVGLSEGLQGSSLNAGNYGQARRRLADGTMHPLWQNVAGSFEPLLPSLGGSARLWYDASDVPFLREDEKDIADIAQTRATTIASLIQAGYTPDSVVRAVESDDFRILSHTGLFSVQLQKPGSQDPAQGGSNVAV
jgi:phage portal protein BeeE